jgi:hypothetical protein
MYQILGPTTVSQNTDENYSVSPADGTAYTWTALGGTIQSGQNTSSITVHWTALGPGSVQVAVTGGSQGNGAIIVIDVEAG